MTISSGRLNAIDRFFYFVGSYSKFDVYMSSPNSYTSGYFMKSNPSLSKFSLSNPFDQASFQNVGSFTAPSITQDRQPEKSFTFTPLTVT